MENEAPVRVKARVKVEAVKIHGPYSPDVIEGRLPEGYREPLQMEQGEQRVELTESQARELLGNEVADKLFAKGGK
jgi:hypothetical protein